MIRPGGFAARMRRMTPREAVLVVLCAASVAAFVLVRWAVFPAVEGYRKTVSAIRQRHAAIARYEAAARGHEKVSKSLAASAARLEGMETGLLQGENPAAAGASLQGILKQMAGRPDVRLISIRALPPAPKGAYSEVAVQMDFQTGTEGLATILGRIPRHGKILRVRKLSVSSPAYGTAFATRPESLSVSVTVSGLAAVPPGRKPEKGAP